MFWNPSKWEILFQDVGVDDKIHWQVIIGQLLIPVRRNDHAFGCVWFSLKYFFYWLLCLPPLHAFFNQLFSHHNQLVAAEKKQA